MTVLDLLETKSDQHEFTFDTQSVKDSIYNPLPEWIPKFKFITLNVNGFGYQKKNENDRFAKVILLVKGLLQTADIICLQETKLLKGELHDLKHSFEGCDITGSLRMEERTAGVIIITKGTVLEEYQVKTDYCSNTTGGTGRVVSNLYTPKKEHSGTHSSFRVINTYYKSGNGRANNLLRTELSAEIESIETKGELELMCGDFNMPEKTSSITNAGEHFRALLAKRALEEVRQELSTFFRMDGDKLIKSRLDKWYTNFSAIQHSVAQPTAYIAYSPCTVSRYAARGGTEKLSYIPRKNEGSRHYTDHLAVALAFTKPVVNGNNENRNTIPLAIVRHAQYPTTYSESWQKHFGEEEKNGMEAYDKMNQVIVDAVKVLERRTATKKNTDSWELGLRVYRMILAEDDDAITEALKLASRDPVISGKVDTTKISKVEKVAELGKFLDKHLCDQNPGDPGKARQLSRVERLSKAFPKLKDKVAFLRTDQEGNTTTDPSEMAKITKSYWESHFRKKPLGVKNLPRFLRRHYPGKKIGCQPRDITLADMKQIILEAGDTAPGPNNIPFAAYKALVDQVAPIFLSVIAALKEGVTPGEGFNEAIFHLLPKRGTGWIEDTRPLSVSNTGNRIIAKAIKWAIQPAILSFLSDNQAGFWPGKQLNDNIEFFNERFYKAFDEGEEYSLFLFDIAKAFDSVSHKTLHAVLKHIGLPEGFRNAINGLFHQVRVKTNFNGAENKVIDICAGIKQGCPLSPLLFIIIMDILNTMLITHADVDLKMFADDTAAGDKNMAEKIPGIKKAFSDFEKCTGLKLNQKKTVLLTTLAPTKRTEIKDSLLENDWGDVKITEMGVYLGIPIGRPPGTKITDAYKGKLEKFRERLRRYMAHRNKLSIAKKIALINVWLLPLFAYPNRFFIIPTDSILSKINGDIEAFLKKGNSFERKQYYRGLSNMGARGGGQLIDIQSMNLASLASKAILHDPEPSTTDVKSFRKRRKSGEYSKRVSSRMVRHTWSMRIKTQRKIAIQTIVKKYHIKEEQFVGKPQREIYKLIMQSEFWQRAFDTYTQKKLTKWGTPTTAIATVKANHGTLPCWVPDYVTFHQIYLTHGALLDSARLAKIASAEKERGGVKEPHITKLRTCYLCGQDGSTDDTKHVYQQCETTGLALRLTLAMLGMDDLAKSIAEFRVITTCETKLQPTQVGVLYLFNHTIWQTREDIKNTERRATGRTLAKEIWRTTITKLGRYSPTSVTNTVFPGNRLPSSRKRQIALRIKNFGAAGKRTEAQRTAAVKQVEKTLAGLPANAVIAFTDGSSLGNPGPAGAGALITGRKHNISSKLSFYLGHHTNQGAELWAIGGVAEFLEGKTTGEEVHIFSDSEFAINCVQRRWHSSKHFKLVEAVRKAISQLSAIVIFHQVAGHANIEGNDIADALAKKGADYSKDTHCAINTDTIIDNHSFLYLTVPNQ